MNLEPFIQSEVNQKEKNKHHMLMHIYMKSRKMVLMSLIDNRLVNTVMVGQVKKVALAHVHYIVK